MTKPHVIVIPWPAQGHIIPIMQLAQCLVMENIKVTFVNTQVTHNSIMKNWLEKFDSEDLVQLVSVPDGMESWEDRNEAAGKLMQSLQKTFPAKLEQLIDTINKKDNNKVACVIADYWMSWTLNVAKKMQVRGVAFFPASSATLATMLSIPKLIANGFIGTNGVPRKTELIRLADDMPAIKPENLVWASIPDLSDTEVHFRHMVRTVKDATIAEWQLCNSAVELEPVAFNLFPKVLSIGPLFASNILAHQVQHFGQQDLACLEWLDQQPMSSVIYVAFGSIAELNHAQFEELALGLELSNRPFLWVVRPSKETSVAYPSGFLDRVGSRGRIVTWAPQPKVLAHPSIACFMSHCGWNSVVEGVTNGIPFLCWPCFADQFYNETYICDTWKTGLGFNKDETGIITREEIKGKIEQLLTATTFKSKAKNLKENVIRSVTKDGVSYENLIKFISWIHEEDKHDKDQ